LRTTDVAELFEVAMHLGISADHRNYASETSRLRAASRKSWGVISEKVFRSDRRLARLRVFSRSRPSTSLSAKRCCRRQTVGRLTPILCATDCVECRSSEASKLRVRSHASMNLLNDPN